MQYTIGQQIEVNVKVLEIDDASAKVDVNNRRLWISNNAYKVGDIVAVKAIIARIYENDELYVFIGDANAWIKTSDIVQDATPKPLAVLQYELASEQAKLEALQARIADLQAQIDRAQASQDKTPPAAPRFTFGQKVELNGQDTPYWITTIECDIEGDKSYSYELLDVDGYSYDWRNESALAAWED